MRTHGKRTLIVALLVLFCGLPASGQDAGSGPFTVWKFFGIPDGVRKIRGARTNRRGNRPEREPKPALKALNDPANLESADAAIKKAAEVKVAEDLAPQKIKAIKYLTQVGCGCYDTDNSITEALVAASDDCTEDVRLATVMAIMEAACGKCCANCGQVCCCKEDIVKRLADMAYERDDKGCYLEPSARVRAAAAKALRVCCPGTGPVTIEPDEPEDDDSDREAVEEDREGGEDASGAEELEAELPTPQTAAPMIDRDEYERRFRAARVPYEGETKRGAIVRISLERRIAHVHFEEKGLLVPVGTELMLSVDSPEGREWIGPLEVYQTFPGCANVRAVETSNFQLAQLGDPIVAASAAKRIPAFTRTNAPVEPAPRTAIADPASTMIR